MGDMAEDFKMLHQISKDKREKNRNSGLSHLEKVGIPFEIKNGGAHLIVEGSRGFLDYWPGTGRWIARSGRRGFGVRNLISAINKDNI